MEGKIINIVLNVIILAIIFSQNIRVEADCSRIDVSDESKLIKSHAQYGISNYSRVRNIPDNLKISYINYESCWIVSTRKSSAYVIRISRSGFNVQPGYSMCEYDYLEFFDYAKTKSIKLCGNNMFSRIHSSGNMLKLTFDTNSLINYAGFSVRASRVLASSYDPDEWYTSNYVFTKDKSTSDDNWVVDWYLPVWKIAAISVGVIFGLVLLISGVVTIICCVCARQASRRTTANRQGVVIQANPAFVGDPNQPKPYPVQAQPNYYGQPQPNYGQPQANYNTSQVNYAQQPSAYGQTQPTNLQQPYDQPMGQSNPTYAKSENTYEELRTN